MIAPAQIFVERLVIERSRAFEGDFKSLVAAVHVGHIALLGEFDALAIRIFRESPEKGAGAGGFSAMEAVGASLLTRVLDVQVRLPAQRLDGLVNQSPGLRGVFLRSCGTLRRGTAGCALSGSAGCCAQTEKEY